MSFYLFLYSIFIICDDFEFYILKFFNISLIYPIYIFSGITNKSTLSTKRIITPKTLKSKLLSRSSFLALEFNTIYTTCF